MKKISVFLILTLACFLILDGRLRFNAASAQESKTFNTKRLNEKSPIETESSVDRASAPELSINAGATDAATNVLNVPNTGSSIFTDSDDSTSLVEISPADAWVNVINSAQVSVSGRVLTNDGRGLSRARMTLTTNTGAVFEVMTNYFGYYRFDSIPAGSDYVFTVLDKHYDFPTRIISVRGDMEGFDFIAIAKNR